VTAASAPQPRVSMPISRQAPCPVILSCAKATRDGYPTPP